ncbi:MAG: Trk system potassium transporter TrkA [Bacteroidia bacterium]|nr:Trk system potassium transporter TrkA [Bacteroidia bacterium]
MKIVIAGAGEVGFHLAKMLSHESQDIILLDTDGDKLKVAESQLDIMIQKGDATSPGILELVRVAEADIFLAVTSSETINITSAILSKKLGAKRTIARISNSEFLNRTDKVDLRTLGVDILISPEELAAKEIGSLLKKTAFFETFEFEMGQLSLVGITLDYEAPIANRTVEESAWFNPDMDFMAVAIHRGFETLIPRGNTKYRTGDQVYFIAKPEGTEKISMIGGRENVDIRNIMIMGGSKIGYKTARNLCGDYNTKVIELNKKKCYEIAEVLPRTLVINGDGRSLDLLEEENISKMDAFVAVTGNSETNIMSCLMAKSHGVKKTIALVENNDYINLSQAIGVDCLINKKLIAARTIFSLIRQGEVLNYTNPHGIDAEVLEFEVKEGSRITKKQIKGLDFPRSAIIGGVIRDGKPNIVLGDFQIRPKDKVVVLCLPEAISMVEKMFR